MTATLDRLTDGRLLINIVTGGDAIENRGDGVFLDHDERYEVTREFLNVYGQLLKGEAVNVRGKHITIEDGRILTRQRRIRDRPSISAVRPKPASMSPSTRSTNT